MELKANVPSFSERGDTAPRPPEPSRALSRSESVFARRPWLVTWAEN
jgi:hypothetical protein